VNQEQHIDLIVMGLHGTSRLNDSFVGYNTEKIVLISDMLGLVVKSPDPDFKINFFLFVCDFADETILVYKKTQDFAASFPQSFGLSISIPSMIVSSQRRNRGTHLKVSIQDREKIII